MPMSCMDQQHAAFNKQHIGYSQTTKFFKQMVIPLVFPIADFPTAVHRAPRNSC